MKSAIEIAKVLTNARIIGDGQVSVGGVSHDSRTVQAGDLFAVLRGRAADGRAFIPDATARGAVALLTEEELPSSLCQIVVPNVRAALGTAAAVCYDYPTKRLCTVGVTGTNGKTTIVYLLEAALKILGRRPGVMSTVAYRFEEMTWTAGFTTPEAPTVQSIAAKMSEAGATHLLMEASSHGIVQGRLTGCRYAAVAFTNLTQDHLDFHGTMDSYGEAKLRLFTEILPKNPDGKAVVNLDDPYAKTILDNLTKPVLTVSVHPDSGATICPKSPPEFTIQGIRARLRTPEGSVDLRSPLVGSHNLSNLLVALGLCIQLGESAESAAAALCGSGAPGRLERVSKEDEPTVLVDYAHTPDALVNVLDALRPLTPGRLICIFGCGGDRDARKRPLMGTAVRERADVAVVTSDNPRTEEPSSIIEMILPGVAGGDLPALNDEEQLSAASRGFFVEPDRRRAIFSAIRAASSEDTVLIAGKGHEDYQILGTTKIHFDDREAAREALVASKKGA